MKKNNKSASEHSRFGLSQLRSYGPLYLMMMPAMIYLFINNYLPMSGLALAFKRYDATKGIWGSDNVGFSNFMFMLKNNDFKLIVRNTICYNAAFIILNVIVGIILAVIITEIRSKAARKLFQSSILFPFVISIIVVSYMVRAFLDPEAGMFNHLLESIGREGVNWYNEKKYWPFILPFVNTWKGVGYGCILYISTIFGIDTSLYEASSLDGASKWQKIRYITLPFLKPTVITLVLISIGRIFTSDFGLFYQVPQNSGMILEVTNTIDTFVYRSLSQAANLGMSSAAAFFQSVIGFSMILVFNGIARKASRENAIF